MNIGQYRFNPSLFSLLFIVLLCALFIRLGIWQLSRADEVSAIAKTEQAAFEQTPLQITSKMSENTAYLNRRVRVTGHFLNKDQILKDNVMKNGLIGYQVLTPFILDNTSISIIVDQGWVAKNQHTLPDTAMPETTLTVTGLLKPHAKTAYMIGRPEDAISHDGRVWLYFDAELFGKLKGYAVEPLRIQQLPEDPNGFMRDKPEFSPNTGKHYSYAIQWFSFSIVAVLIFLYFNLKSPTLNDPETC